MNRIQLLVIICVHLAFIYNELKCQETSALDSGGDNTESERVQLNTNELDAIKFLKQFNENAGEIYHQKWLAEWNYYTNKSTYTSYAFVSTKVLLKLVSSLQYLTVKV